MKVPRGIAQALTVALALAPLASAWPGWLPDIDSLVVRQDDASTTADSVATSTATSDESEATSTDDSASTTDDSASTTTDSDDSKTTNSNTGTITKSATKDSSSTKETNTDMTRTTFDSADQPGGVTMITPAATAGSALYRIESQTPITWVWNYTSLQGTPSAIDVLVSCSKASATWTLTQNMTFEPTATFTWDTNKYQEENATENPLLTEQYTLLIYDADSSISATAEAGYLSAYSGFTFGLYTARPYTPLGEWKCATCSAASGDLERKALGFALSMSLITILTFTWYVTGIAGLM
ncbi:hypothetical protein F4778DRAFT_778870 [Xylariomycetidae sp. FL2044]|nr:hypothetical protein F4778DRAFT_778870 [Xylariomycetidae sp. FL2044]